MYNNVFISYARENSAIAENVYNFLHDNGYEPWLDKKKIKAGQDWLHEINKALKKADFIILILSEVSVSKRGIVQTEFKTALEYCKQKLKSDTFIIPVKIDDCEVPFELENFQYIFLKDANDFATIKGALDAQSNLYKKEKGLLTSKVIIMREDEYKGQRNFRMRYYITGKEPIYSDAEKIEFELNSGKVEFNCNYRLWEGHFGSRNNGYMWMGKSETFTLNLKGGENYIIRIKQITPYKSLRGGVNGILRVGRRLFGAQIPESYDTNTYPINIRISIDY